MSPLEPRPLLLADDHAMQTVQENLRALAQRFEPDLRDRVSDLLAASARAILDLWDLDLIRHEDESGGHTLALWEELAPVMAGTVESVNRLISSAETAFPSPPDTDALDNLDDAFRPSVPPPAQSAAREELPESDLFEGTEMEIAKLLRAVNSGMRRDVARLGERLRNPTIVSDPWNLISDLLEFRGRMRAGIGEVIFQVCSFVAEVERVDVLPGYATELEGSLLVREATTNLAFLFRGHAKRIGAAPDERVQAALQDSLKDLHAFSRTRALPQLRTSDKRIFLETRAQLYRLVKDRPPKAREIKLAAENLARFLDSMSVVSRRENLRLHDRAQLAAAGRRLEAAQSSLGEPAVARAELVAAVRAASALYGRDAQLDAYLRAQRHFPADWLHDPEVPVELEKLVALLAGIAAQ